VTAAVVGLIAGTTLVLLRTSIDGLQTAIVFGLATVILFKSHGRLVVPLVIAAAALWGFISSFLIPPSA
jgi:chromate transporter